MRSDVRHLLCLLTKDNEQATKQLNEILISAVGEAVNSHKSNPAVVSMSTQSVVVCCGRLVGVVVLYCCVVGKSVYICGLSI